MYSKLVKKFPRHSQRPCLAYCVLFKRMPKGKRIEYTVYPWVLARTAGVEYGLSVGHFI